MTLGTDSAAAHAPGWYPDPADAGSLRWWSGDAWTEHLSPVVTIASADSIQMPTGDRFARDPARRPVVVDDLPSVPRQDPYRERNVFGGLALIAALVSIPYTIADAIWPLPDIVSLFAGGTPIALAMLGVVASIKLGFPARMAVIAVVISAVTMGAGFALDAQQVSVDLPIPTVTDVPGLNEITELQDQSGLSG